MKGLRLLHNVFRRIACYSHLLDIFCFVLFRFISFRFTKQNKLFIRGVSQMQVMAAVGVGEGIKG